MKTPILFLVFNRSDTTKKVFAEIRKVKPEKLFVAADGPRDDKPGEKEKCDEVRKITEVIDWKCDVKQLYRDNNLGCRKAVSSAIDWYFDNVEEGIILEDDCLPNTSFFEFCEKMLTVYRNEKRVMHIGGVNFQNWSSSVEDGYYFSKYIHIWGWATWRRAWKGYDIKMKDWLNVRDEKILDKYYSSILEKHYWNTIFDAVYRDKIDTWDYQLVYHVWKNRGLSVVPNKNLVKNIGFNKDALHTTKVDSPLSNLKANKMNSIKISKKIIADSRADDYSRRNVFNIKFTNVLMQKLYYDRLK